MAVGGREAPRNCLEPGEWGPVAGQALRQVGTLVDLREVRERGALLLTLEGARRTYEDPCVQNKGRAGTSLPD